MRLFKVVKDSIDVFVIEIARIKIAIQVIRQIENNPHNHIYAFTWFYINEQK